MSAVISEASQTLGVVRRNCKTAYTASAWSPWILKDITRLEGLQCTSVRFVVKKLPTTASTRNIINK